MPWQGKEPPSTTPPSSHEVDDDESRASLALVVVWAKTDGARLGEAALSEDGRRLRTRPARGTDDDDRVGFVRQRPKKNERAADIDDAFISRKQLRFEVSADEIAIESIGKRNAAPRRRPR